MHDDKAVFSCQVLYEDRNICTRFDQTLQMADDYITASQSEASCLCIMRGRAWIINFFQWSENDVIIMQVWDQPCAAPFLMIKRLFILTTSLKDYVLLHILQLSHLLLDDKKKHHFIHPATDQ